LPNNDLRSISGSKPIFSRKLGDASNHLLAADSLAFTSLLVNLTVEHFSFPSKFRMKAGGEALF
jgi:hypothetical protein